MEKKKIGKVDDHIEHMLSTKFKNKSGLIYCLSRKDCEKLCHKLQNNYNIKCEFYHADIPITRRNQIQEDWMNDEVQVIVATIAFGMGINKRDVRFVIHYNMPKSFEGYVQECGRAGRDQKKAYCFLYYEYNDRKRHDHMIGVAHNSGARKKDNLHALYSMVEYCEEPYNCRR